VLVTTLPTLRPAARRDLGLVIPTIAADGDLKSHSPLVGIGFHSSLPRECSTRHVENGLRVLSLLGQRLDRFVGPRMRVSKVPRPPLRLRAKPDGSDTYGHSPRPPASRRHRAKHLAQVARARRMAEKEQERAGRLQKNLADCQGHAVRPCENEMRLSEAGRELDRSQCHSWRFSLGRCSK
jgi:hypothetical protein